MNTFTFTVLAHQSDTVARVIATAAKSIAGLTFTVSDERCTVKRAYDIIETRPGCKESVLRNEYAVSVIDIALQVPELIHNGWKTVAKRDGVCYDFTTREVDAMNEVRAYSESLTAGACEHCRKNIIRNEVYIVQNASGELKQVGGGCVAYYVPAELRKALRALAVTLSTFDQLTEESENCRTHCAKWIHFGALTVAMDNAKDMDFVPSKDRNGNPNMDATWRRVTQHAQDIHLAEVNTSVLDFICKAGEVFTNELTAIMTIGEWVTRRDAAMFVTLHRRAQMARPEVVKVDATAGRQVITGKVVSRKVEDGYYGVSDKIMVEVNGGAIRFWGTNPKGMFDRGDEVTFTATVEPKETGFAFFSRPTVK